MSKLSSFIIVQADLCRVSGHDLRLQEIHLKKVRKNDHIGESMVTRP